MATALATAAGRAAAAGCAAAAEATAGVAVAVATAVAEVVAAGAAAVASIAAAAAEQGLLFRTPRFLISSQVVAGTSLQIGRLGFESLCGDWTLARASALWLRCACFLARPQPSLLS